MKKIIEEWRWIVGYEGMYQISNIGRVKSFKNGKERIIHLNDRGNGYLSVSLCKEGIIKSFQVHQLICMAFLDDYFIGCGKVVNHIDGNRLNNKLTNLEIVTQRENVSTCIRKNLEKFTSQYPNVYFDKLTGKWVSNIYFNGKHYHLGLFKIEEDARDSSLLALSHIINGTFLAYYYELINKLKNKLNNDKKIKILQYNKDGEFIKEWDSSTEAGKELKINQGNISNCCRGSIKSAGGFLWKYKEEELIILN